jgi:nucleoside-diphosphate-sugar epimerase
MKKMGSVDYRLPGARALPRRFRRPRVVVLGCGDVGLRFARLFGERLQLFGVVRRAEAMAEVRQAGALPLQIDLDDRKALRRLNSLRARVLHSAPPAASGIDDPRTRRALAAMADSPVWVYLSTSGVYGDCEGRWIDETQAVAPRNDRAIRRVAAERRLRAATARGSIRATILRVPGIYAGDRLPIERLQRGTPALVESHDVYTNHIHADDLARIAFAALWRGRAQRVLHAVDDSDMKMGEYFDAVADAHHLPRPDRLPREALKQAVSPMLWSFMSESRRLSNNRLKRELRLRLMYPTVRSFLDTLDPINGSDLPAESSSSAAGAAPLSPIAP